MYKEIIDEEALKMQEESNKKKREYYYASDVFQCMRKIWYEFHVEKDETICMDKFIPAQIRVFHNGNFVHDRLVSYLKHKGLVIQTEINVPPPEDINIHGRVDALVGEGESDILEFKSISMDPVKKPKYEHLGQINFYMHQLKRKRGFLIYESKQTQEVYEFEVNYDPVMVANVFKFFKTLQGYVERRELPPIFYTSDAYPCKWRTGRCRFYKTCWKEGVTRTKGSEVCGGSSFARTRKQHKSTEI